MMYELVKGVGGFLAGLGGSMIANRAVGLVFVPKNKIQNVCGFMARFSLAHALGDVAEKSFHSYCDGIRNLVDAVHIDFDKHGVKLHVNQNETGTWEVVNNFPEEENSDE